jgi:hypothetical protein
MQTVLYHHCHCHHDGLQSNSDAENSSRVCSWKSNKRTNQPTTRKASANPLLRVIFSSNTISTLSKSSTLNLNPKPTVFALSFPPRPSQLSLVRGPGPARPHGAALRRGNSLPRRLGPHLEPALTTRAREHTHTHTHTHTHKHMHARTMSDAFVYATCVCTHTGMAQADRRWSPCLRADGICKCPRLLPGPSTHERDDNRHRFSGVQRRRWV